MRRRARFPTGRVLALGCSLWFRRFFQLHAVAALCLAPLLLRPTSREALEDISVTGLFGLYSSAWVVAMELSGSYAAGLARNVTAIYLAQVTLMAFLVRDAHRHLAGRDGRKWLRALPGIFVYAMTSLAAFVCADVLLTVWTINAAPFLGVVGLALAGIAEAILAAWFWLALPAAAVDGHGFFASLRRSRSLARGAGGQIAALVVLLGTLQLLGALLCGLVFDDARFLALPAVLFLTLRACVLAAAYREICVLREGPGVEELGAVFA